MISILSLLTNQFYTLTTELTGYRTRAQGQIDLIIDGFFGILPIEIKQGVSVKQNQLITLSKFIEEHSLPFGLLINQSTEPLWLTPKIYQLPVGWV